MPNKMRTKAGLAFAARLNQAMDEAGHKPRGRQVFWKRHFRIQQPSVSDWFKGYTLPRIDKIRAMAKVLGVRADWLERNEGPMREIQSSRISDAPVSYISADEIPAGYVRFPQLEGAVSAGQGAHVSESLEVVRHLDVAEWWAAKHLPRNVANIKIMAVRGDSMAPEIKPDDLLFIDTSVNYFDGDGIYVFNWNGHALVKRLAIDVVGGRLKIFSMNPAYQPDFVAPGDVDQLHISGRVAAWWTLRTH